MTDIFSGFLQPLWHGQQVCWPSGTWFPSSEALLHKQTTADTIKCGRKGMRKREKMNIMML